MHDRNAVRLSLVHALPSAAEASGVSLPELLSLAGLAPDAFDHPDLVVRRSQIHAIMQGLARKSGDATIGFRIANASNPERLGSVGRSLQVGRTLQEALILQRRHMPSMQRGATIGMSVLGTRFQWHHRLHGSTPDEARFLNEGIAAFVIRTIRALSGDEDARLHLVLPHRPIVPLGRYEEALRCAVSFVPGQDMTISFDASLVHRRNLHCHDLPRETGAGDDPVLGADCDLSNEQLAECLLRMFEVAVLMGRLTLRDCAQTLGLSPRSLQRRLAEIDTSFEEILDRWRHGQALTLLLGPDGGTAKVAARLGYSEAAHFIRAFRRWEGVSPTTYRLDRAVAPTEVKARVVDNRRAI